MPDPRREAAHRIGGRYDVRVLEPSPPAVGAPDFADDPVAGGELVPIERPGTRSWDEYARDAGDPDLDAFCAERWLGRWHRLAALPATFASTRAALHSLAEHVLAPARHRETGRIGLRYTRGGFGTPFFGADRQLRVDADGLHDGERGAPISTLRAAAAFVDIAPGTRTGVYEPSTPDALDEPLGIDRAATAALGAWFGFACSVLEQLREQASRDAGASPGRVQLWPEHFDLAVDLGDGDAGARANFGGSPGDATIHEPYLYVGPWTAERATGPFWNAPFGAALAYSALVGAPDQRGAALAFFAEGYALLRMGARTST